MPDKPEKHSCTPDNVAKFRDWFANRGGLLIWRSVNLSNPGASWTSPALTVDGKPCPKPTWQAANTPERHITDPADVVVLVPREVKRFHVAVRPSSQGLSLQVSDGGTRRIRAAVARASKPGNDAWYEFDYHTQEAVIYVADKEVPLPEWKEEESKPLQQQS